VSKTLEEFILKYLNGIINESTDIINIEFGIVARISKAL